MSEPAAGPMTGIIGRDLGFPGRLEPTSVDLRGGELTCLIGPNGSGKTSLLHALAGIGRPGGTVRIDGVDPRTLPPAPRSGLLSYLPASRDVAWPLRAGDLVALGLSGSAPPDRIRALYDRLGLADLADRRADLLSTGERSRILIARALVAEPKLLLLDEPTANLDPLWQLRVMDYLRQLARTEGRAVLIAVHDLELARRYADRLLIMRGGRLVADGMAAALLAGGHISEVFGVERGDEGWRPLSLGPDRRSLP